MSANTRSPNSAGDDLDKVLTAYFQAEMPAKWPGAPWPSDGSRPSARLANSSTGDPATRTRWALAASVALLIGSVWYLSGKATDGQRRPDLNFDGTADTKHAKEAGKDKGKVP